MSTPTPPKTPQKKSSNPIPNKERMKMPRQHMLEQLPQVRNKQFTEVNLGYSTELARQEALRCIECAKPACVDGPEFDAHRVDFAVLVQRNAMYREAEKRSMEDYQHEVEKKKATAAEPEVVCALEGKK